ncbi:MAG: glycosyltransferase, partial [Acidobacteriota bacterium]
PALPATLPRPRRVLVLGGSQGSAQLNRTVPRALAAWRARAGDDRRVPGLTVVHQAGRHRLDEAARSYADADLPADIAVEIVRFVDDVAGAMAAAQLILSRAGAITLAELCAAGRPSLLVPLIGVAGAHQDANARVLENAGAAVCARPRGAAATAAVDDPLVADLADALAPLVADDADPRLAAMASAARALARSDATDALADRLVALAGAEENDRV